MSAWLQRDKALERTMEINIPYPYNAWRRKVRRRSRGTGRILFINYRLLYRLWTFPTQIAPKIWEIFSPIKSRERIINTPPETPSTLVDELLIVYATRRLLSISSWHAAIWRSPLKRRWGNISPNTYWKEKREGEHHLPLFLLFRNLRRFNYFRRLLTGLIYGPRFF